MYDDYEIDQAFNNESYAYDLDEMCEHHYHMRDHQYAYLRDMSEGYEHNDDDDYARDSCDYDALAYRHYAWYNKQTSHEILMYTHAQKRHVCVTLDIECYDDLEFDDLDWREMLDLQGDENVQVSIKETADIF